MPASAISEYGSISDPVGVYASTKALFVARKAMVFYQFGEEEEIPKGQSVTINWRRWKDLPAATAPIQGNQTPPPSELENEDIRCTVRQYGKWIPLPKFVLDTNRDPILNRASDRLGYNMKLTYDTLMFLMLRQSGHVVLCEDSGTSTAAVDRAHVDSPLQLSDLRKAVTYLRSLDVLPYTEIIDPNPKVGTRGIEESYFGIFHSYQESSIRDLDGFLPVAAYPNRASALPGEFGSCEAVRFIRSNVITQWKGAGKASTAVMNTAGNADVFPLFVLGRGAFGVAKIAGTEQNKVMVVNASPAPGDELGQRGSAGWIGSFATRMLDDSYMVRLECAVPKL